MREIKFRAWIDEELLSHEQLIDMDQETHAMYTIITNEENDDGVKIMQYTGLKDKNGKEIYEGDILAIKGTRNTKYVVGYREYSGGWQLEIKGEYCAEMTQGNCDLLKVIGNIYENPELLEVTA